MMRVLQPYVSALSPNKLILFVLISGGLLFLHHAHKVIAVLDGVGVPRTDTPQHESMYDPRNATAHDVMIHTITNAGLFGSDQTKAGGKANVSPATTSLQLRGIFAGSQGTPSYAIIEEPGNTGKSYRVGDTFGTGLKVFAIYSDRVIVSDGKSQTILRLRENSE